MLRLKKKVVIGVLCAALAARVFAGGSLDDIDGASSTRSTRGGLQTSGGAAAAGVYDVDDLPYVPDETYYPEANPRTRKAVGELYVTPSDGLRAGDARLPPPVHAISGVRGQRLDDTVRAPAGSARKNPYAETVDVFVNVGENDYFVRDVREGFDATTWIENLPEGLRARAHHVSAGKEARVIGFYITGVPRTARRSEIRVVIPAGFLASGRERTFVSSTEELENIDEEEETLE